MADALFTAPLQMVWHAPKKRDGRGRDPAAGPERAKKPKGANHD